MSVTLPDVETVLYQTLFEAMCFKNFSKLEIPSLAGLLESI